MEPKTAGIPPAKEGPLQVLQFKSAFDVSIKQAARRICTYQKPNESQAARHEAVGEATAAFLEAIVALTFPGPERSTAISRAREARMWANAAIAMEPHEGD